LHQGRVEVEGNASKKVEMKGLGRERLLSYNFDNARGGTGSVGFTDSR